MKKLLTILAVIVMASPAAAQLVLTGVIDGPLTGGVPKAVEVTVCGDVEDLSIFGIGSANNGGGTDGVEWIFPAVAASAGDVLFVASEDAEFTNFFGFAPDFVVDNFAVSINGDDAVELFDVSGVDPVVIDVFGDIDVDGNGTPWEYQDGWAKRNTQTGPDGDTFMLDSWSFSGPDALDDETDNATAVTPYPLDGYECDPNVVSSEEGSWDSIKSMYR